MSQPSMNVIGLISGTSVDGIDGVVASIQGEGYNLQVATLGGQTFDYPPAIRQQALAIGAGAAISMPELAALDEAIAQQFAQAAQALIDQYGPVNLIGSHGQTVFHRPRLTAPRSPTHLAYSLQLGRGDLIATLTQCPTVSDFRQADIAAGGEGAPLVPPVDLALLSHPSHTRCVQNIGGIGNVALLPPWPAPRRVPPKVLGWDTGPGNSLLDLAVDRFSAGQQTYDGNGAWAAQGTPHQSLVDHWLQHPYFAQLPPKSTGRELFGQDFLQQCLTEATVYALTPADVLASLTELTARSIAQSYQTFLPALPDEVLICGGGSHNHYLLDRLQTHLPTVAILPTTAAGVPADLKEALAFAVLAYWRHQAFPGNLPSVTGAHQAVPLGNMHWPVQPQHS
ncbi:MAG: anhydro-N-acetylmuramic acid kinase [Cyanobacteria bacterium P01_H01_bin.152]